MLQLLKKIADGKGTKEDMDRIRQIGTAMQKASLCGLGQTAPNPVLSTMKFFKHEYDALLKDGKEETVVENKEDAEGASCRLNNQV